MQTRLFKEEHQEEKAAGQWGQFTEEKPRLVPLKKPTSSLKKAQVHSLKKTLKISYATPQGKDHVTISPRSSGSDNKVIDSQQQNGKKTSVPVQNKKLNGVSKGAKDVKQNRKPRLAEKKKVVVNGFHHSSEKSKPVQLISTAPANPVTLNTKHQLPSLKETKVKEKEKENTLSSIAAKEVLANSLKVHLVQDIYVPCSKGKSSDTSSESSYASSVSPKRSKKQVKVSSTDFIKQEETNQEDEIKVKKLSDRNDILGNSNENLQAKKVPPLNLKIHKKNVTKYRLQDGRTMCLGDIVWGKIIGFPWWPGRISQIVVSRRDNGAVLQQEAKVRWLGATTISHIQLDKLYPFLPYFKERYNKKRRGVYKSAISQAMEEAKSANTEVRELNTMFETSQIC